MEVNGDQTSPSAFPCLLPPNFALQKCVFSIAPELYI